MKKSTLPAMVIAFVLGGAVGAFALLAGHSIGPREVVTRPSQPVWTEVQWPFLMDQWGKGKAFHCGAKDCGTEVDLYLRAKIGFCNCATGVSDDEELERLSDFDLMGTHVANLGDGRPITVAWMKGRSRSYAFTGAARGGKTALSVAFNDRCDAIVATVVMAHDQPGLLEPGVLEFLNGKTILRWAEVTLGL